MAVSKLGLRIPNEELEHIEHFCNFDTGNCADLYESDCGKYLGTYHDAVGLVTWWHVCTDADVELFLFESGLV